MLLLRWFAQRDFLFFGSICYFSQYLALSFVRYFSTWHQNETSIFIDAK